MANNKIFLELNEKARGLRLDQFLAKETALGLSRSYIQKLIKGQRVWLNGALASHCKMILPICGQIEIDFPEVQSLALTPKKRDLKIFYEDEHLLVLDKPAGLLVHPGNGNWHDSLVHNLLYHCKGQLSSISGVERPGIVHRLDKDTSGVMVVAKSDKAHQNLADQFFNHGKDGRLERRYLALIWGTITPSCGVIDNYIGRDKYDRLKKAVVSKEASGAKRAISHYQIREVFYPKITDKPLVNGRNRAKNTMAPARAKENALVSLVNCRLETGRTHQIRVHMAQRNNSLLGDKLYGKAAQSKRNLLCKEAQEALDQLDRQALHAAYLSFIHPLSGARLCFASELPKDMQNLLTILQRNYVTEKSHKI